MPRTINVLALHTELTSGTNAVPWCQRSPGDRWHVRIPYSSLADLARQLVAGVPCDTVAPAGPVQPGEVLLLGIVAHGLPGVFFADGSSRPGITRQTLEQFRPDLRAIRPYVVSSGWVYWMGCQMAARDEGPRLVRCLSTELSGRHVVGFTTVGINPLRITPGSGAQCREADMRDSNFPDQAAMMGAVATYSSGWNGGLGRLVAMIDALPLTSNVSPHHVTAFNGRLR